MKYKSIRSIKGKRRNKHFPKLGNGRYTNFRKTEHILYAGINDAYDNNNYHKMHKIPKIHKRTYSKVCRIIY